MTDRDEDVTHAPKRRCAEIIERRPYPQARYVTSRKICKNWCVKGSTRCAVHGGNTWSKGDLK